ncbi:MAG: riboflavin synthase [Desulfobacterales bacterium]|nr:riboflavin synthase [Desulfobacterales bacterium]
MFTGLVEGSGKVKGINRVGEDMRLTVAPLFDMTDNRTGDSISVNGVCLTVTEIREGAFTVDVSGETLSRSTLGELKMGDEVNLERAVRLSDRLGGHLVSGHVDGVGKIAKKVQQQRSCHLRIGIDEALSKYIVEKGSIAVDGISLTINSCSDEAFEVNIIPETGRVSGLLKKRVGDKVNIETDLIGKYIEKFLFKYQGARQEKGANPISEEMLKKHGFGD